MKNRKYFILGLICFAIFMGCSSTDDVVAEEDQVTPSSFTIVVEPLFGYADVVWTNDVGGANNSNLSYDLYLNNNLVISNLEDLKYTFENLNFDTEYQLKIIAKNTEAETVEETTFKTLKSPENYTFLLKEVQKTFSNSGETFYANYSYNEQNQLIEIIETDMDGFQFSVYRIEYDNESRLKNEFESRNLLGETCSESIEYSYESDVLKMVKWRFSCGPHDNTITLDGVDQNEYTYHFKQEDTILGTSYEYNAIVNLEFNNQGQLITYTHTLVGASSGEVTKFEYTDGNMTRIQGGGNVENLLFDDQNSKFAFGPGNYGMIGKNDRLSMGGAPYNGLRLNPALIGFENKNNINGYLNDSQGDNRFVYTYTPFGYPETLTILSNRVFSYSYIFVEN